jgi:putative transposase
MTKFIDTNRDDFGVEPICRTLQVASSTYYEAKKRPLSARAIRDAVMMPILLALFQANYSVYGVRKLWIVARRAGHDIGRDQTARLMRQLDIAGVRKGKRVRTTRPDDRADRPPDLVERDFTANRPNRLWVTDLTYVPTWAGVAYVCFIVDAFSRRIVGWRVALNMRTAMVLDALEMARWSRGTRLEGLVAHSDAGSQGGFNWSSQHLSSEVVDGTATWVDGDVDGASGDAVAGPAASAPRCRAGVLGEDCCGFVE